MAFRVNITDEKLEAFIQSFPIIEADTRPGQIFEVHKVPVVPWREALRSIGPRVARLERLKWLRCEPQCVRLQVGNLETLPDDYTEPRHVVTVKHLPPGPDGEEWYEWEKRPGHGPASNIIDPNETLIHVCYAEPKAKT